MGQHGAPGNGRRGDDAPTTSLPVHRVGPLGSLHDDQRRWHPVGRVLWWAFLLPLAIFAWSSWRLRGTLRVGGYVLAGWVLLFGVLVVSAPTPPPNTPTTAAAAPVGRTVAAPTPTVAVAPPAPVVPVVALPPAPVVAPKPAPVRTPLAPPVHAARPVAPKPSRPTPAPKVVPTAPGNAYGDTYTNVDGNQVQRPVAAPSRPAGATAKCQDGTWSFSQHHSGTCSGHGGVAQFL